MSISLVLGGMVRLFHLKWLLGVVALTVASAAFSETAVALRNSSFEDDDLSAWKLSGVGEAIVDDDASAHGRRSIKLIRRRGSSGFVNYAQEVGLQDRAGDVVELSASIRASGTAGGVVSLSTSLVDSQAKMVDFITSAPKIVPDDGAWHRVRTLLPVTEGSTGLRVAINMNTDGTVWVDDFKLRLLKPTEVTTGMSEAAEKYLNAVLSALEKSSAITADWSTVRQLALYRAVDARNEKDLLATVRFIFQKIGDKHAHIIDASRAKVLLTSTSGETNVPIRAAKLANGMAYLQVPGFASVNPEALKKFGTQLVDALNTLATENPCGWIVDLRANSGGNIWPMLAGIGPLLGDGEFGYYVFKHGKVPWRHEKGAVYQGSSLVIEIQDSSYRRSPSIHAAVLVGPKTSSSGEMLAVSFLEDASVRFVGASTAGMTTSNQRAVLPDGSFMLYTTAYLASRKGQVISGPIVPGIKGGGTPTSDPADDSDVAIAATWLKETPSCTASAIAP